MAGFSRIIKYQAANAAWYLIIPDTECFQVTVSVCIKDLHLCLEIFWRSWNVVIVAVCRDDLVLIEAELTQKLYV